MSTLSTGQSLIGLADAGCLCPKAAVLIRQKDVLCIAKHNCGLRQRAPEAFSRRLAFVRKIAARSSQQYSAVTFFILAKQNELFEHG